MPHHKAVIQTLEHLGGIAILGVIYQEIFKIYVNYSNRS